MPVSTVTSPTSSAATPTITVNSAGDASSDFSTGAKVGVVAAFGLGLSFAYFLFRRRERSRAARVAAQPLLMNGPNNEMKDYQPVNTDPYSYYGQRELAGDLPHTGPQHMYQTPHEVP